MSISAISEYFELDWKTVKDCEKKYLKKKFKYIPLKDVKVIGIDELYVRTQGNEKYITIVRDLESGSVLYVGNGKGIESLASFTLRLKRSKATITTVAMDMSRSYVSWVNNNLPSATIVFDHFHVIKLMNEKLDKVRRRTGVQLGEEHRKLLKNQRILFLRNKEALRSIYQIAKNECQAEAAFKNWRSIARQTEIKELADMAKTIENHLAGITACWKTNSLSISGMDGFNNKVRCLISEAYGFKDKEYFILKIYNLPENKNESVL